MRSTSFMWLFIREKIMSKKNKNNLWAIIIIAICLIFLPSVCRQCRKPVKKPIQDQNQSSITPDDNRYHLNFKDDFKTGLTMQDDLGISIVIAIDCSGSMDEYPVSINNNKKYVIASQSLTEITNFLENFYNNNLKKEKIILKIGLIKFSDTVNTLFNLSEMNDANFNKLKQITSNINNFLPTYKTAIGKTIEKGTEILVQSGTIFKSLIIITDGENTINISAEDALYAVVNNLNNKSTKEFPVLTDNILVSFVGFDIDSSVFNDLKDIGARITSAGNKEELNVALKNIFLADIKKLEAK